MAKNRQLTKDERIKKEERRLKRIYKNIDKDNKAIIEGLIQRAAYMRVTLEEWEKDIMENGCIDRDVYPITEYSALRKRATSGQTL